MSRGTWETSAKSLSLLPYRTLTFYGEPFQTLRLRSRFVTLQCCRISTRLVPATPKAQRIRTIPRLRFRLFPFRSPLLRESHLVSFPWGTKMFQFPQSAFRPHGFRPECPSITTDGFPHSGIPGSTSVCDYPRLIAAYHALRRLLIPRHPPYTLSSLIPNSLR